MSLEEQLSILQPLAASSLANLGVEVPPSIPAWLRQPIPPGAIGSAAYAAGIARLGWPALQESDAGLGVANMGIQRRGDEATALPSSLALAATFNVDLAERAGRVIGAEAHSKGFNVQLAGGVDLARDPRNGRNFEYAGEDPLLAGLVAGAAIAGVQSQHVVSTVKHYALNDQETGRTVVDVQIDEGAARESDLLAFQIAIDRGHPGAVMCAYNKVNGVYACENPFLLTSVLKQEWGYPGWVMSDWGAVHSLLPAIRAGLDQQSPQGSEPDYFVGLSAAIASKTIDRTKVREMTRRIVRSVIAAGAFDDPARPGGNIDKAADAAVAESIATDGMVLLKNEGLFPLKSPRRIAVIGGHADIGVAAGGGSSFVTPYGGIFRDSHGATGLMALLAPAYGLSSPLKALQAAEAGAELVYDDGRDPSRAAALARTADVALVFAVKAQTEGSDAADLTLPDRQDELIAAVASANPNTGVVLETGNPVLMPWLPSVKGVLEAWYPGQRGGQAIAAVLSGATAPSGRLPMTFPASVDQLPRPKLDGLDPAHPVSLLGPPPPPFAVTYAEGSDVGYRWYEKSGAKPLFPFGFGLTYTRFDYQDLSASGGSSLKVRFRLKNVGDKPGVEIAQVYVAPPGRTHRLVGWSRVALGPGESRVVTVEADPRLLASWDAHSIGWTQQPGTYDVRVAPAAGAGGLHAKASLVEAHHSASWRTGHP